MYIEELISAGSIELAMLDEENTQLYYDKIALFDNAYTETEIERFGIREAYLDYIAA